MDRRGGGGGLRPPSFGDHPNLTDNIQRNQPHKIVDSERTELTEIPTALSEESDQSQPMPNCKSTFDTRETKHSTSPSSDELPSAATIHAPSPSQCPPGLPFPDYEYRSRGEARHGWKSRRCASLAVRPSRTAAPTLFLQEAAHLVSLLSAVALSDPTRHWSPYFGFHPGARREIKGDARSRAVRKQSIPRSRGRMGKTTRLRQGHPWNFIITS